MFGFHSHQVCFVQIILFPSQAPTQPHKFPQPPLALILQPSHLALLKSDLTAWIVALPDFECSMTSLDRDCLEARFYF